MSEILTRAREHFARFGDRTVEVPEWGEPGAPLVVHHRTLSLRDRQSIARSAGGSDALAALLVVIRHARNAEGERLFSDDAATRKALENEVDPTVIGRIAAAILKTETAETLGES